VAVVMCGLWQLFPPGSSLWWYAKQSTGVVQLRGAWGAGRGVQGAGCRVQGAGCRVQGAGRMAQGAGPAVGEWAGTLQVVELYPRGGQVARDRGDAHDARRGRGAQQRHQLVRQQEVPEIVHLRASAAVRTRAREEASDGERGREGDGEHA
jgi:hypothetical protein